MREQDAHEGGPGWIEPESRGTSQETYLMNEPRAVASQGRIGWEVLGSPNSGPYPNPVAAWPPPDRPPFRDRFAPQAEHRGSPRCPKIQVLKLGGQRAGEEPLNTWRAVPHHSFGSCRTCAAPGAQDRRRAPEEMAHRDACVEDGCVEDAVGQGCSSRGPSRRAPGLTWGRLPASGARVTSTSSAVRRARPSARRRGRRTVPTADRPLPQ